jgi:hypothetical protein
MGPQAWTCPLSMVHLIVKSSLKHGLQAWSCPLTVVHLIVKSSLKHGPLNAPIKLKLGQQIGVGLLIVSHLDQLLWWANQKHRAPAISYLLDSFLHFPEPNRHVLDFLRPILLCRITYRSPLESISIGAQYVNLPKYFSHPSSAVYFFAIPPIKLKQGLQIGFRVYKCLIRTFLQYL